MMGIIGAAILVGLSAGGITLYSGSSVLTALGAYVLFGWMFILAAITVTVAVKVIKIRAGKQNHVYSS